MESKACWEKKAACKGQSTEVYFPDENTGNKSKKSCTVCPVKGLCMTYAVAHEEVGIWGGTFRNERRRLDKEFVLAIREAYYQAGLLEYRPGLVEQFLRQKGELLPELSYPNDDLAEYEDSTSDLYSQAS